ncbi:chaperone modulator CbpM [Citrobacter farmeri]|uniref:chaperone modulator CbpM n=1 Tax=Citrobacter farmeri TaxID=67824 RepID=UPI0018A0746B|nr:chaperone modulator CbpM [Citrobacter farmeri]EHK0943549.1 chaperone modulator CbpM [Citrobacter farmeri]EKX4538905.1 chaperone modulator CbpM [Citrobacter farmeri]MDB2164864.1 chaperone modulator CbpM [Citrobacter farmeri]GJL47260.1 chaperone modulatory protein CbpM [Citrobacter farmeri]HBC0356425.1 chaperone modulator CbpM [Citrobacter farmeri]
MANVTITFTVTEFCLRTGVTEEDLNEIVGLGVIEPYAEKANSWQFDDHAATVVQRALRLREELALDWPGIAVALTLLEENAHLRQENRLLRQRLARFITHP